MEGSSYSKGRCLTISKMATPQSSNKYLFVRSRQMVSSCPTHTTASGTPWTPSATNKSSRPSGKRELLGNFGRSNSMDYRLTRFAQNLDGQPMFKVLITPGANIAIFYAVQCLVEPGDEVIVPDPGFPTYYSVLKACGAVPVRVPLRESNHFRMHPDDVQSRITSKTRMIMLNSPHNPTGSVMTGGEIRRIAEIAKAHDVYLFSDEIYARMYFADGITFSSPSYLDQCRERTIVANGWSKAFAMTGWRVGAVIGPHDVIAKMDLMLQTTSSCVPPFIQYGALEAMTGDQSEVQHMTQEYQARMQILVSGLNDIPGIRCLEPGGALYVFPNISGTGMTSEQFSDFALDKAGVALLPGTNFGEYGEGYIRMCVVNSRENIAEGILMLKQALLKG